MTDDTVSARYTENEWIWFNIQGCSIGYWLPRPYQDINSAGQKVTVKPARITDQDDCETEILGSMFNVCFDYDEYDMVTVNLAELPSETGTGAPAQGYPSYVIALQQAGDYEDAICYNANSVRVSYDCFQNSFRKF